MAAMFASARSLSRCFNRLSSVLSQSSRLKINGSYQVRYLYSLSDDSYKGLSFHKCAGRFSHYCRSCVSCNDIYQRRGFNTSMLLCESHVVKTPPFAESVTEGDVRWDKAVGDSVEMDEVIGEIETDKTSIPIHAPVGGVIEEILVQDGDKVVAEQELCKISMSGDAVTKPEAAATPTRPSPDVAASPMPPPASEVRGPIPTSPPPVPPIPVAEVRGPTPTSPPPVPPMPTGPMKSIPTSQVKVTPAAEARPLVTETASRTEQRVKMTRMRQRIAQRLKDAQNTCAMLTTFNEIDMSNVMELRTKYKDAFLKKHNVKLGFMSAFIKASAAALTAQPVVNAVIDDVEIVYRNYIDISVAVATPKGLVVPVLRDVGNMSYADIEKGLNELGEKARAGTLAIEDMDGGTFTISNGGVFGSLLGTPIINPPQSAILGMHGIFDRPVAISGKVEIRPMMYVALTYDHRLIDGREAAIFLRKIKSCVEDPCVLLLDF